MIFIGVSPLSVGLDEDFKKRGVLKIAGLQVLRIAAEEGLSA